MGCRRKRVAASKVTSEWKRLKKLRALFKPNDGTEAIKQPVKARQYSTYIRPRRPPTTLGSTFGNMVRRSTDGLNLRSPFDRSGGPVR